MCNWLSTPKCVEWRCSAPPLNKLYLMRLHSAIEAHLSQQHGPVGNVCLANDWLCSFSSPSNSMNQWIFRVLDCAFPYGKTVGKAVTAEKGLTLIELLISFGIISILSAIALPSLLNFSSRARHSEAQITVSSILRAQQGYYLVNGDFTRNVASLALGISDSEYYRYKTHPFIDHRTLEGEQVSGATAIAEPLLDFKGYMGKVWADNPGGNAQLQSVLCEGDIGETYFMNSRTYCP